MMQLKVWGGAGEHGRSSYWIGNERTSILLDCGVKREGTGEYPLLDSSQVVNLDAVFLSHAHEDHSIAIPLLYKLGYTGKVWTTRITVDQLPGYYSSWGNYVKQHGDMLPYEDSDITKVQFGFLDEMAPPDQWIELSPTLRVRWGRSGHMLGSVWLLIEMEGKRLFYSGDYSEDSWLLGTDSPENVINGSLALEGAIIDAAYSLDEQSQTEKLEQLYAAADGIIQNHGQLLLPVPVCGRGQDLLLLMRQRFPDTPIRIESEIMQALESMLLHPSWLKAGIELSSAINTIRGSSFEIIQNEEQRQHLLKEDISRSRAAIWFTNDGMMQSPKCQWYYEQLRQRRTNGIILTGHVAAGTTAQKLLAMSDDARGCQMQMIRYKIHQGLPDVRNMTQAMNSSFKLLVHAPKKETAALVGQLTSEGIANLISLLPGDSVHL